MATARSRAAGRSGSTAWCAAFPVVSCSGGRWARARSGTRPGTARPRCPARRRVVRPTGSPPTWPAGTLIAGEPAMFQGLVSESRAARISSFAAPATQSLRSISGAVTGTVGSASTGTVAAGRRPGPASPPRARPPRRTAHGDPATAAEAGEDLGIDHDSSAARWWACTGTPPGLAASRTPRKGRRLSPRTPVPSRRPTRCQGLSAPGHARIGHRDVIAAGSTRPSMTGSSRGSTGPGALRSAPGSR